MPSYRLVAPRLARCDGIGVVGPTKHFIRHISILRLQTERVGWHLHSADFPRIAGRVGEASVARHGAFVVGRGGTPLAIGACIGLYIREGGAAEEEVFQ